MSSRDDDKLIREARARWGRAADAESKQRESILAAKRFRSGDQWPDAIKRAREGGNALSGMPPQPPRPCLVVDRLSQPVRQVSNTIKQAEFGFDVDPNGSGADEETADIFKGYLRMVQAKSRGESPIEWAADGAIEGGIGWFRMRTDYVYETWDGDPTDPAIFDQEIKLERIANNLSVYCDPSACKPTRSDAQWMFITEDVDKDEFKRRWSKADIVGLEAFMTTGDMPGWVDKDIYRIAEYWYITYKDKPYSLGGKTRVIRQPTVNGCKINAVEVLERWEWAGSHIPIIPVLGEELNIEGSIVLRGVIQEGMDAQRMVNYTYSGAMEIFALGSKSPYIAAAGQVEEYRDIWQTANIYNYSHLPYDPISIAGTAVPPPQRDVSEAPIQAAVMLMQTSENAIKATTGLPDAALGNVSPTAHSGRAIQALQSQSDLGNGNYSDNVMRALVYAGELMVEIIPKITRKGQILHILGVDDETEQVMVGQPFQKGQNGVPQASPAAITPGIAALSGGLHEFYDLTKGRYGVTVTVGKFASTRREESRAALGDLLPHLPPEMAAVLTPEYIESISMPGAHKMAEKARKALPPALQDQPEGGLPPQVQAQLQGLQAQLQQAQQEIATDQAKQQATLQKAQMDNQVDMQKAQLQAQTDIQKAQLQAQTQLTVAEIQAASEDQKAKIAYLEQMVSGEKEARLEAAQNMHDHHIQGKEQAHEVAMTAMEQAHEKEMSDKQAALGLAQQGAQQSHESDMAQQAQAAQGDENG